MESGRESRESSSTPPPACSPASKEVVPSIEIGAGSGRIGEGEGSVG